MKKISMLVLPLICMLLLSACHSSVASKDNLSQQDTQSTEDVNKQTTNQIKVSKEVKKQLDDEFEKILSAIKNKDKDEFYKLFNIDAKMQDKNFDEGEAYVFDLMKGNVTSWKAYLMEKSIIQASYTEIYGWYVIETDQGTYKIFISSYINNDMDKTDVGIYALRVIRAQDEVSDFTIPENVDYPGIYVPNNNESKE